jgi:hypothetical protein
MSCTGQSVLPAEAVTGLEVELDIEPVLVGIELGGPRPSASWNKYILRRAR